MAEKASIADYVVLTTDDPRDEPYETILSELAAGMQHDQFACIGDREEAVRHAVSVAGEGDIIIFAGKGHEDFQIIGREKLAPFRCRYRVGRGWKEIWKRLYRAIGRE